MFIPVTCSTNLDSHHRESWPRKMCGFPLVGQMVQSESGKLLQIVEITHKPINEADPRGSWLHIELHNRTFK